MPGSRRGATGGCVALVIGMTILAASSVSAGVVSGEFPARRGGRDPLVAQQWGLERISAAEAWKRAKGAGVVVAVLDTGADLTHPDLRSNLVIRKDADIVEPGSKDGPQDPHGHGTHVAGIIAGIAGNGEGIAGVAPKAKVLPVRVMDANGAGMGENIAAGIRYAADQGADVINLSISAGSSLGSLTDGVIANPNPNEIQQALQYAWEEGVVIVAAAGNSRGFTCDEPGASENVVCVGATGPDDELTSYSNYDPGQFDTFLVAPGGDGGCQGGGILSTYPTGLEDKSICGGAVGRGYSYQSGTSMASPMVAGVAALLVGLGLDNQQVVDNLTQNAEDLGIAGRDPYFGYGMVDAAASVESAAGS